jgi:ABC-type nitrate/sulfonate/bicarbonate transport system substrate-binding protein
MTNKASGGRRRASEVTRRGFLSAAAGAGAVMAMPASAQVQGSQAGKPLKEITIGEISRSGTGWARVIAAGKGYFAEEGLAVDSLIIQGGPPGIVRQVVGGSLDIGVSNFDIIIRGIQGGGPIIMIGSSMIKFALSVVAAPGIKSAADLKGKTVSVSSPKDPTALFLNRWLRQNGMSPGDVDVIYVAATQDRFAALLSGTVAAVALTQPFDFRALDRGFNRLIDYGQMAGDNYGFLAFTVRKQWLQSNPETARGFLRALKRGSDWLHEPGNKEEAISLLAADIKQDKALVTRMYDYYLLELKPYSRTLAIQPSHVQGVLDAMVETKELTAPTPAVEQYIDLSYLPK